MAAMLAAVSELAPARVLRRTLEEALTAKVASAVLFEALGTGGGVPRSLSEVLAIVHGPLRAILEKRLGASDASALVAKIEAGLRPVWDEVATVDAPLDELAAQASADATAAFPVQRNPVMVAIVAGGPGFELRLATALGPQRAAPFTVRSLADLRELAESPPGVLLVDASDFPPVRAPEIVEVARKLPRSTACVLYGCDLPYGNAFLSVLAGEARPWVTLELREGIAPLLDLIRSRRAKDA